MRNRRIVTALTVIAAALGTCLATVLPAGQPAGAASALTPATDPFYRYTGATPLSRIAPGTVLKTREISLHALRLPLPVRGVQVLYRTTDELGAPMTTVATVLRPILPDRTPKLISYQSFYDSLTPDCEPSYILAGGPDRGMIVSGEVPIITGFLLQGYTVVTADFEGQHPSFATGPAYGRATLDGIRAALHAPAAGLPSSTRVGMIGYSGGAIATEWAAELAPRYAPDVNRRLVGAALGGVLVDPAHNLHYVDGSRLWAGVMPMALIGIARAFHVDLTPYLSSYGKQLYDRLQNACFFTDAYGRYPGLTFAKLVKPQYARPESIPSYVRFANQLIMGTGGTPTIALFIRQATNGDLEGTPGNKPGIGPGDAVMIAGDVRTLAREYCARGTTVDYREYRLLSHVPAGIAFFPDATPWLDARFAGRPAPDNCASIKPGNPITPIR